MNKQQIEKIANTFPTPLYVFDISILQKRVAELKSALPAHVNLCFAVKANTFIIRELVECIERFELCSPGEVNICESLCVPESKMVISGVNKTPAFIEDLIQTKREVGVYTVESRTQFRLLYDLAEKYRVKLPVLLRLTSGNQFGLNEDEIVDILQKYCNSPCLEFKGIQYFSGTQKQSLKRLKRELDYLDDFLLKLQSEYGFTAEELEFGPGLPVAYFLAESYDEAEYLTGFSELLDNMRFQTQITLELGRSIAASCGTYLTRVVDVKKNRRENYAILDGGIHHLVYYGQTMAMKIPKFQLLPQKPDEELQNWNLCGSLCTINDILVKQLPVRALHPGDLFAFETAGAYCMTEGISLFLSRALPTVVLLKDDKPILVRESKETYPINTPNYESEEL